MLSACFIVQEHRLSQEPQNKQNKKEPRDNLLPVTTLLQATSIEPCPEGTAGLSSDFGRECASGVRCKGSVLLAALFALLALLVYASWPFGISGATTGTGHLVMDGHRTAESNDSLPHGISTAAFSELRMRQQLPGMSNLPVPSRAGADIDPEYELGQKYADGTGTAVDYAQAMAHFAQAAMGGDARAQWELGQGYLQGIGVPQDDRKAAEWLKKAANRGDIDAQDALSELYLNGWGVPKNYVRAYTWAGIAAGSGSIDSSRLREIAELMTPDELRDAQQRISNWNNRSSRSVSQPKLSINVEP